jgi:leader peptidase (prepilin peptidase)/N-methyltransferase
MRSSRLPLDHQPLSLLIPTPRVNVLKIGVGFKTLMNGSFEAYVPQLIAGLFGLIVGSFANVCIHRIPLEQSIVFPPSRCPKCQSRIAPWHNLPVVSWLLLGGRCASCRQPISRRYPLVEAVHGAGFFGVVHNFGLSPFTPVLLFFFTSMVVLALIDWDHQILPDVITLPGIAVGIATTFVPGALVTWKESVLSAVLGFVAFFLVANGYSKVRGIEGLGMGDWKLAAMMGAFLGARPLLVTVFLGSLSGMTYGIVQALRLRRQNPMTEPLDALQSTDLPAPGEGLASSEPSLEAEASETDLPPPSIGQYRLPFGTFLAASAVVVLFWGDSILSWYSSFFPA